MFWQRSLTLNRLSTDTRHSLETLVPNPKHQWRIERALLMTLTRGTDLWLVVSVCWVSDRPYSLWGVKKACLAQSSHLHLAQKWISPCFIGHLWDFMITLMVYELLCDVALEWHHELITGSVSQEKPQFKRREKQHFILLFYFILLSIHPFSTPLVPCRDARPYPSFSSWRQGNIHTVPVLF